MNTEKRYYLVDIRDGFEHFFRGPKTYRKDDALPNSIPSSAVFKSHESAEADAAFYRTICESASVIDVTDRVYTRGSKSQPRSYIIRHHNTWKNIVSYFGPDNACWESFPESVTKEQCYTEAMANRLCEKYNSHRRNLYATYTAIDVRDLLKDQ